MRIDAHGGRAAGASIFDDYFFSSALNFEQSKLSIGSLPAASRADAACPSLR